MRGNTIGRSIWWAAVLAVAVQESAFCAASLDLGLVRPDGDYVSVPIEFTPDETAGTAGLQFDLEFDPSQFAVESVVEGYSAVQSAKDILWSEPVPGTLRVIVAGMNQTTMPQGAVASVYLVPRSESSLDAPCAFSAGVASGPFGEDVPLDVPVGLPEEQPAEGSPEKTDQDEAATVVEAEAGAGSESDASVTAAASPAPDSTVADSGAHSTPITAGGSLSESAGTGEGPATTGYPGGAAFSNAVATAAEQRGSFRHRYASNGNGVDAGRTRTEMSDYARPTTAADAHASSGDPPVTGSEDNPRPDAPIKTARVLDSGYPLSGPSKDVDPKAGGTSMPLSGKIRGSMAPVRKAAAVAVLAGAMVLFIIVRGRVLTPRTRVRRR